MRKITCLFISAALLLAASPLFAQPGAMMPRMPRLFGSFTPKAGVWSEYSIQEKSTGKSSTMRMAVVGLEDDAYWYEVKMVDGGETNIIKMLLRGDPGSTESIQRLIIKSGNAQAMEMPAEFLSMGRRMAGQMFESRSGAASPDSELQVKDITRHEVTVPAGTFKTVQRRIVDAEGKIVATYDFNSEVLPIGVVRSDSGEVTMELLGYGTDARSLITEEPMKFQPPPGMMSVPPQ